MSMQTAFPRFHDSIDILPVGTRVRYDVPDDLEDSAGTVAGVPTLQHDTVVRWDDNGQLEDVSFDTILPADAKDTDAITAVATIIAHQYDEPNQDDAFDADVTDDRIDGDTVAMLIVSAHRAGRATGGYDLNGNDIAALRTVLGKRHIIATPEGLNGQLADALLDASTIRQMMVDGFNAGRRGEH